MKQFKLKNKATTLLSLGAIAFSVFLGCTNDSNSTTSNCADPTLKSDSYITVKEPTAPSYKVGDPILVKWETNHDQVNDVLIKLSLTGGSAPLYSLSTTGSIDISEASWGNFSWKITDKIADDFGDESATPTNCAVIVIQAYNDTPRAYSKGFKIVQ